MWSASEQQESAWKGQANNRAKVGLLAVGIFLFSVFALGAIVTSANPRGVYAGELYRASMAPCPAWTPVASPNSGGGENVLFSVSAASAGEIWAVGYSASGPDAKTLALRWDGKTWQVVPSPNPGQGENIFEVVAAIAPNTVWALGNWRTENDSGPFIVNWNGQEWKESRLPEINPQTELYAMSARSSDDIWAVGSSYDPGRGREGVLFMHYNGVDWRVIPVRTGNLSDALYGVTAIAPNDAWAVGYSFNYGDARAVALHWDGEEWTLNNPPAQGGRQYVLNAVTAASPSNVWAVGYFRGLQANSKPTLLVNRWDGSFWSQMEIESPSEEGSVLLGVASSAPNDVWAVGYFVASGQRRTLLMHYDGNSWTKVATGDAGEGATLYSVAVPSGGDPIAVGYGTTGAKRTLIERYADACAVPTPTETSTPVPATNTPVPVATVQIPGENSRTFVETGKTVRGLFLDYWDKNGGLPQQGYPISEVMGEVSALNGKPYTVQYFERAVFEYHPENQAPYDVLLSQLGTFRYKAKYPSGAPGQQPNNDAGSILFAETGKRVGGKFLDYWQKNGGLAQQGFPISDEFTEVSDLNGKSYTVQYFERAVFELHPENQAPYDVLLSQLGTFQYKQKYGGR